LEFYVDRIEGYESKFQLKMLHIFLNKGIKDDIYYWSELNKIINLYCQLKKICPELDSINIGGGFHHAFPDHGEGFCMIHDVAVAIRRMQRDDKIRTAMTVDCDVHHGNGTAAIFAGVRVPSDPLPSAGSATLAAARSAKIRNAHAGDVFTISLHQEHNYPAWKPPSSIDVDLPDGIGDADYLAWLDNALSSGLRQFEPDLMCYIAGADPYKEDQLGGLSLTIEGLKKRDELVFRVARARDIPVMVTFAGGYARRVDDTVTIHCNTVMAAKGVFGT